METEHAAWIVGECLFGSRGNENGHSPGLLLILRYRQGERRISDAKLARYLVAMGRQFCSLVGMIVRFSGRESSGEDRFGGCFLGSDFGAIVNHSMVSVQ